MDKPTKQPSGGPAPTNPRSFFEQLPTKEQLTSKRFIGGAAGGLFFIFFVSTWIVSSCRAESRAADLLSASADMVRCVGGDEVKYDRASIHRAYHRRMVSELPDISSFGDCGLALATVKEKFDDYDSVWITWGSNKRLKTSIDALSALPFKTPSSKVLSKKYRDNHPLLKLPSLVADLYEASHEALDDEGASEAAIAEARDTRLREARRVPPRAPAGMQIASFQGKLPNDWWGVEPLNNSRLTLHVRPDRGSLHVLWSDDAGKAWKVASGLEPIVSKPDVSFRTFYGPKDTRWYVASHREGEKTVVNVAEIPDVSKLPPPTLLPPPPPEWSIPKTNWRDVVVLSGGALAFPVTRIGEKPDETKKEEEEIRKAWKDNLTDPQVQREMFLDASRAKARLADGIDADHQRFDGIAYVVGGAVRPEVLEISGYGLAGMIPAPTPMMLLGAGGIPAITMATGAVPEPGQPVGMLGDAGAPKPMTLSQQISHWYRCTGADGWHYRMTTNGTQMLAIRPGVLEIVHMTALASENSHLGCGQASLIVGLPFMKDRIFANALTIKGGEIEGAKIATTAGTTIPGFDATVATGVVPGAVVLAWIADGLVEVVVSQNWGTEFRAPTILAETGEDGSRIVGVRLVGMGPRMVAIFAREACTKPEACTTTLEVLVSDDAAKTWRAPGGGVAK